MHCFEVKKLKTVFEGPDMDLVFIGKSTLIQNYSLTSRHRYCYCYCSSMAIISTPTIEALTAMLLHSEGYTGNMYNFKKKLQ
ncbi:hypothetical protein FKM82_013899 [Ascaphus truei]